VGSAESEAYDQVLDTVFVGPVPEGRHMFVFQVIKSMSIPTKIFSNIFMMTNLILSKSMRKHSLPWMSDIAVLQNSIVYPHYQLSHQKKFNQIELVFFA